MIENLKRDFFKMCDRDGYFYALSKATGRTIGTIRTHWFKNIKEWEVNIPKKFQIIAYNTLQKQLKKEKRSIK